MTIADIGASPGSWSLYCLRKMKGKGSLCAVDLKPFSQKELAASDICTFIQGDIFDETIAAQVTEAGPFNLIVSDAAPATTGNRVVDCGRSYTLVEGILLLSEGCLSTGGSIVLKIFQGGDEQNLITMMKKLFTTVKTAKPKASRNESFEIFLVGLDKK